MNRVKIILTVCLLTLVPAALALAQDKRDTKPNRVEKEVAPVDPELPEIPKMPPGFGMEDEQGMGMFAFADKDKEEVRRERREHAERIQLFRLWKIMEEVDLSDEQVDKFFPLMREYGKQERELAGQRGKLMWALRKELRKDAPSDDSLKETLSKLKVNSRDVIESKNKVIEDAAQILSVRQQAKLALSLHEVERNIWESIARIRHMPVSNQRDFGIDKEKLHLNMQQLKENLDRIKQEFEAQGLPAPDINFEGDGDVELKFRQPSKDRDQKDN